ncbi:hypothetical protein Ac2012v2_008078 [Leucoagaricus gongylophorus]
MEGKTVSFFKSSTWGKTPWREGSHDLSSGPMTSSGSDSDPITRRANYTFIVKKLSHREGEGEREMDIA